MTYEEVFDRCVIIRDTLLAGSRIALEPTLENIEFITMCAEAAEFTTGRDYYRGKEEAFKEAATLNEALKKEGESNE